jgi:hypothetical protein
MEATARELLSLAGQDRVDLAPAYGHGSFLRDGRIIWLWRKGDAIQYSLQGPVVALPHQYTASAAAFRGMYDEAGSVADIGRALELLSAWLLDRKEVDALPSRSVRSSGIG